MSERIKKGDIVKIADGSYAVRIGSCQKRANIGVSKSEFLVLDFADYTPPKDIDGDDTHDIFIQEIESGEIFLHSSCSVRRVEKVEPAPKELTVSEISEKLGYKVKVVEG